MSHASTCAEAQCFRRLDPDALHGFLIFSHVGDDWRTCRDHVRMKHGLGAWVTSSENERSQP
jgi:hypothetical protein